ncbi:MAG: rRNA pseudouridine synthase [Eubacterium sp.]|nr:rRNA pseudouridine synthase [Eubacterium sp.]
MNLRLDKYLADFTELTRSQAKKEIREGRVQVNGEPAKTGNDKVAFSDSILWDGREIRGQQYQYIMLNKPAGIISSTADDRDETVVEYIKKHSPVGMDSVPEHDRKSVFLAKDLFPVGRLDKDTEGLLILTNDGELAHRLLSPRHHVAKKYFVRLDKDLNTTDVDKMREGLDIGEKRLTSPAALEILAPREALLTITEGKFHQVKRMFAKLGKNVIYLKRTEMGTLTLDESLAVGEWRVLTEEEIQNLINIM